MEGEAKYFLGMWFENILQNNPTAKTIWKLVQSLDNREDLLRPLSLSGHLSRWLRNLIPCRVFFHGLWDIKLEADLDFPKKKLRVLWFSPPDVHVPNCTVTLEIVKEKVDKVKRFFQVTLGSLIWGEAYMGLAFKQLAKAHWIKAFVGIPGNY
ncbi:unnamed protein product [Thlaspi arvense]|uniref:Uncharacterized protein n=1 Tax=Thlaspi arvense TaxID=13288 RepID=A0AAU9R9D1_THLAR|nr:unnamed protein product [Thlaspi arvense]